MIDSWQSLIIMAQKTVDTTPETAGDAPGGILDNIPLLVFYIVIFGVMIYFMMIRPQKQEKARRADMMNSMKKGSKVITAGGIIGTIQKINDTSYVIESANTKLEIGKNGVSMVVSPEAEEESSKDNKNKSGE